MIRHNQRPRHRLQAAHGLQHSHTLAALRHFGGGIKSSRGTSYNDYFFAISFAPVLPLIRLQQFRLVPDKKAFAVPRRKPLSRPC
jgi:hypothetical protein